MAAFTLKTGLNRGSRIREMIARELKRGGRQNTLRLMRLKALLLKVEERLQDIIARSSRRPAPVPVPVRSRRVGGRR